MPRIRSKNSDLCGDCGAIDASWASVNRGILLCSGCCSVHRGLGQHVSQIKSLKKSPWHPNQLEMFNSLVSAGANNIWEHCLLDSSTKFAKRKPQPKDPIHPNKKDFIYAKHKNCQFILKPEKEFSWSNRQLEAELSKQLHSSVRTSNLETSLRLLSQGADPNFFHDEKGTTPLHVAAKSNQLLQTELLLVYGADPKIVNSDGRTALQVAKFSGNLDLYNRLNESMFEVIDRLTFFLCGQKPDHKSGRNLILPEAPFSTNYNAKNKLQMLPNQLFKELMLDVYEEIDRRELEAIWLSNVDCLNLGSVPFLPVDSRLSSTRNQGRQKLARFTVLEVRQLVNDILVDIQRRNSIEKLQMNAKGVEEDHVYDSVASDDYDYVTLPPINENIGSLAENEANERKSNENVVEILTNRLLKSNDTINELKDEIRALKLTIEQMKRENGELKTSLLSITSKVLDQNDDEETKPTTTTTTTTATATSATPKVNRCSNVTEGPSPSFSSIKCPRPISMFETKNELLAAINSNDCSNQCDSTTNDICNKKSELKEITESVTKSIQELWSNIQSESISNKVSSVFYYDKVNKAIHDFLQIIPKNMYVEDVEQILTQTALLKTECIGFQKAVLTDSSELNYYTQQVRLCAYEVTKIFKSLLTKLNI